MTAAANAVAKESRYVLTNIAANNNKFWNIRLFADGSCETHWGRVGEDGQRKTFPAYTEAQFDAKCREKEGKGYRPQRTLANTAGHSGKAMANEKLADIAGQQIQTDSAETQALINYLARVNVHRILQATTLSYDESRGTFATPLGVVTKDAIEDARKLLATIGDLVHTGDWADNKFVPTLNDYLMLIPQNVGRAKPDPKALFPNIEAVRSQNGILDSLEASLQMVLSANDEKKAAGAEVAVPKLFEAKLTLVDDVFEIERIRRKYHETRQAMHVCHHLDVKRVFRVDVATMRRAFEEQGRKIGGVQELWHGTRAGNLLSILKGGFVIPPSNAPHCTGRLFGNGVYFANASTKSLNYAYGYWGAGQRDENCFMFLADVAMGKHYVPKYGEALPKPGYDSTWAKKNESGVQNDELIVYNTCQINPTFLIEFAPQGK